MDSRIKISLMKVSVYRKSDLGRRRSLNEDNYIIIRGKISEISQTENKQAWTNLSLRGDGIFLAAIDGMGGLAGGQIASQSIVNYIAEHWLEIEKEKSSRVPVVALEKANEHLKKLAEQNPDLVRMGAVATSCYLSGGSANCAQVGDSRLYLFRDGEFNQISEDQTFVSNLVRMGKITPKEAESHPQRNVVSQALGPSHTIKPVDFKIKIKPRDKILICSDGLHGLLSAKEIANILSETNGDDTVNALVTAANEQGGTDNITVLIAEISV